MGNGFSTITSKILWKINFHHGELFNGCGWLSSIMKSKWSDVVLDNLSNSLLSKERSYMFLSSLLVAEL